PYLALRYLSDASGNHHPLLPQAPIRMQIEYGRIRYPNGWGDMSRLLLSHWCWCHHYDLTRMYSAILNLETLDHHSPDRRLHVCLTQLHRAFCQKYAHHRSMPPFLRHPYSYWRRFCELPERHPTDHGYGLVLPDSHRLSPFQLPLADWLIPLDYGVLTTLSHPPNTRLYLLPRHLPDRLRNPGFQTPYPLAPPYPLK